MGRARAARAPPRLLSVGGLEIGRLHLAALILLDVVRHALVFAQRAHSRALHVGDVDERVGPAALRLDKAETFGLIEKLDDACGHLTIPYYVWVRTSDPPIAKNSDKEGKRGRKAPVPVLLRP